jgi:glycosyltransferase involved in cell wall biosynthesis
MYVSRRSSQDPSVIEYVPPARTTARLGRFLRREQIARSMAPHQASASKTFFEIFTDDRSQFGADPATQLPSCDILNLHWIAGFIDYRAFVAAVPPHLPIVWRLADMNAFTGGCHFDAGCGRFTEACGCCPQLGSTRAEDLSRSIWKRKRDAFRKCFADRLHIVTLTAWMTDQVRQSSLLSGYPVTEIPNGVDLNEFAPRDKCLVREVLGIPQAARVVLFVADSTTNRRKGFSLLAQALNGLAGMENLFLLSVGRHEPELSDCVPHLHLGPVEYRWLYQVYNAADVFVIPSLQDNLPNTVLESMACGTPVVGFAVGGIPDMVRQDITGILAPASDVPALQAAVAALLMDGKRRAELSRNCRQVAVEEYSVELQARRYSELYASLVAR